MALPKHQGSHGVAERAFTAETRRNQMIWAGDCFENRMQRKGLRFETRRTGKTLYW